MQARNKSTSSPSREIGHALAQGNRVIPVLADEAPLPSAEQLPETLSSRCASTDPEAELEVRALPERVVLRPEPARVGRE